MFQNTTHLARYELVFTLITNNTKLDARYVINHGKMVLSIAKHPVTERSKFADMGAIQFCKY